MMFKPSGVFGVALLVAMMAVVNACGDDEKPEKNECTTASECGDDHICTDGSCVPDPVTSTPECTKDSECDDGESCDAGECIPGPYHPVICADCDALDEDGVDEAEIACIERTPGGVDYMACNYACDAEHPDSEEDWEDCTDVCEDALDQAWNDAGLSEDEAFRQIDACLQDWVDEQDLACDVAICWF